MNEKRPTLVDVAQTAGVSRTTASEALNGRPGVHPETKRLVLEAAERLGYRRDDVAAALRSGSNRPAVGLRMSNLDPADVGHVTALQWATFSDQIMQAASARGIMATRVAEETAPSASCQIEFQGRRPELPANNGDISRSADSARLIMARSSSIMKIDYRWDEVLGSVDSYANECLGDDGSKIAVVVRQGTLAPFTANLVNALADRACNKSRYHLVDSPEDPEAQAQVNLQLGAQGYAVAVMLGLPPNPLVKEHILALHAEADVPQPVFLVESLEHEPFADCVPVISLNLARAADSIASAIVQLLDNPLTDTQIWLTADAVTGPTGDHLSSPLSA